MKPANPRVLIINGGSSSIKFALYDVEAPLEMHGMVGRDGACQQPALETWHGREANVKTAQQALLHRTRCNRAARRGEYTAAMEKQNVFKSMSTR